MWGRVSIGRGEWDRVEDDGGGCGVDSVLQVCVTPPPPCLASGSAVPAGATPARGDGPSGQRGLCRGGGGGSEDRASTRATLGSHCMIYVKGGG